MMLFTFISPNLSNNINLLTSVGLSLNPAFYIRNWNNDNLVFVENKNTDVWQLQS